MKASEKELSFEENIKKLEQIVQELETGEVPLDDAINKFTEACKIAEICDKKLKNATNSIMLTGNPVGDLVLTGAGAGAKPIASSVVGDLLVLASELDVSNSPLPQAICHHSETAEQINIGDTYNDYYISVTASNNPGAIGMIGTVFGQNNINISTIMQKGINLDNTAEIVVITETAKEADVQNALKELLKSPRIKNINNLLRVMN